jgi:hypothetical protein
LILSILPAPGIPLKFIQVLLKLLETLLHNLQTEGIMKKIILLPTILILFLFCGLESSHGDMYYRTYEVVAISDNGLTLVDEDGNQIEVNQDPKDYKVGYKVRYDNVRGILKKERWQDYTVLEISSDSITLIHKNGDKLKLESGDLKTHISDFKKGEAVSYDSVDKHLKLTAELHK